MSGVKPTGRGGVRPLRLAALIVPDLVHPFFAELAKGLSAALAETHSLVMASTEEEPEVERQHIATLLARDVDALFIASVQTRLAGLRAVLSDERPVVLVDRRIPGWPGHYVGMDDRRIGQLATEHLIAVGCRRIAHIAGADVSTATDRRDGYRQALIQHGLPASRELTIKRTHGDDLGDESGYRAMRRLLRLRKKPDGVFCNNDPTAMGAMRAILEAGLDVPGDIAVVGCGDVHYAKFLRVPLTSVAQQPQVIGTKAGELALAALGGRRRRPPTTVLLAPTLQVRQSTAGP
ncbi:MAG: substrate-binding domain-containing protein, partial [Vicinamibacteraceae bacterium]